MSKPPSARKKEAAPETAESMAQKQREISVSEFFLKNRHLLGFDSPRRALLTAVKEAVDNALDACEEAHILPEISVDIQQTAEDRFRVTVTDNGPGIVRNQIPKIFAKLLYGSKFHRLRMSRGQQGIGISAAGMYGQLTTGTSTVILSRTSARKPAHHIEVQIDARQNKPNILKDEENKEWKPTFYTMAGESKRVRSEEYSHGTSVAIEMEAAYVRGRLSVDEYLKQCAIVNPHLALHYRIQLQKKAEATAGSDGAKPAKKRDKDDEPGESSGEWITFERAVNKIPKPSQEIKPHPHGVELGMLMQMLKDSTSRTLRSALASDFSRVSTRSANEICQRARLNPKANPTRVAHQESEALFKAISETKIMRPSTDCLSPIGEDQILAGLKKEIEADFYTAVTREPTVYRGNPFQIEAGIACAKPQEGVEVGADEPVRLLRFANRVPLLYMGGACATTKAVTGVNWKTYGLSQPKDGLPVGPVVIMVHMASVWVPFTSESKDAIASYPEILREMTFALQECGRQMSGFLSRRHRALEAQRKRDYIELYIPHLALGLKQILDLKDKDEDKIVKDLKKMLEKTHLDV
jgi:DNA topoisomerase-6 subunit B